MTYRARIEFFILVVASRNATIELGCWRLHKEDIWSRLEIPFCHNTVLFLYSRNEAWMVCLILDNAFSFLSFDLLSAWALIVFIVYILFFNW